MKKLILSFLYILLCNSAVFFSAWLFAAEENTEQTGENIVESASDTTTSSEISKPKPPPKQSYPLSINQLQASDLTRYLAEDEMLTLMAGEDTFPVLVSEETTYMKKGVAILLSDWSLSPSQHSAFEQLRHSLNEHGWVTLAASSSDPVSAQASLNAEQAKQWMMRSDTGFEFFPADLQQTYQQSMQLRLAALLNEAERYQGIVMVVAQGVSAGVLINHYHQQSDSLPEILTLLQPYLPDNKANKTLAKKMAELDVPILDIWSNFDNPWALATVRHRQVQAKKHLTLHYRQRQLFGERGAGGFVDDARLTKEIIAYSKYLGW